MFSKPIPVHLLKHDKLTETFRHWQLSQPSIHTLGEISSAAEFARFCKDTDDDNFGKSHDDLGRRVASRCGHLLHPATPAGDIEYCAVCEVIAYLNFLGLINDAWDSEGSPWAKKRSKNYGSYVRAWHKTRIELEELVEGFEVAAEYEGKWEEEHPEGVGEARKTNSARLAIHVARFESKYPAAISVRAGEKGELKAVPTEEEESTSQATPPTPPATPTKKKPKKSVNFTPDTKFERGRSNGWYMRSNPRYEPGDHAVAKDEEPIDTSFMDNPMYNLRQLKVIVNPQGTALEDLMNDIAPEEYEGTAEAHSLWPNIRGFVVARPDDEEMDDFQEDLEEADFLLVKVEGGEVVDVQAIATMKVEDMEDEEEDGEETMLESGMHGRGWTSHLEILPEGHFDDTKGVSAPKEESATDGGEDGKVSSAGLFSQDGDSMKRSAEDVLADTGAKRTKVDERYSLSYLCS